VIALLSIKEQSDISASMGRYAFFFLLLLLVGCGTDNTIVNNVSERDANEIVVFLSSKGIEAQKMAATSSGPGASAVNLFNIAVDSKRSIEAMALLNHFGLPRRRGTNLLTLFAKSGLMSTDREETIRYQAGLAEQLSNTINKFDGVIDSAVEISFPPAETVPGAPQQKTTAAVYIKHQGLLEDPNSHIETKVKRLMAGSVPGLDFENVSVITDRARFSELSLGSDQELIGTNASPQTYASIWSIVMTKSSLVRFRVLFFILIGVLILLCSALGWMTYKYYFPKKDTTTSE
jgi:type III secretion protein J